MPAESQKGREDQREILLAFTVSDAVQVVEAVDPDMLGGAHSARDDIVPARPPPGGQVGQIFCVMKRGHGLGIGAQPKNLPVPAAKLVQRRARSVIIVPWLVREQVCGPRPARAEAAARIGAQQGSGPLPEDLGQPAHLGQDRRIEMIEGWRAGEQAGPGLGRVLIDPVHRIIGAEHHQQGAGRPDHRLERIDQPLSAAPAGLGAAKTKLAQRRVNHD
jgi:hypothetical protein